MVLVLVLFPSPLPPPRGLPGWEESLDATAPPSRVQLTLLKICDVLLGLRVSPEHEIEGLDLALHGEEGYIMEA